MYCLKVFFSSALIFGFLSQAHASALLQINNKEKTVTIVTNLFFYGDAASELNIEKCMNEISDNWEIISDKNYIKLGRKNNLVENEYQLKLKISGKKISSSKAFIKKLINKKFENNFIKLFKQGNKTPTPKGYIFRVGANTGAINDDAIQSPLKICSHEYGHILGLPELNSETEPPSMMTQSGVKTPFLDYQLKDYDYQYVRSPGTFDTSLRKVKRRELTRIKSMIKSKIFLKNKSHLGQLSKRMH